MAYSEEEKDKLFSEILIKISIEGMALRNVLKLKNMPSPETFYKWLEDSKEKSKRYAYACEERSEIIFEEILGIADDGDSCDFVDDKGVTKKDGAAVQLKRLQVDARKWYLSKINPKKYSDKIQLDQTEFSEQPLFPDVPKNNSNK